MEEQDMEDFNEGRGCIFIETGHQNGVFKNQIQGTGLLFNEWENNIVIYFFG